MIQAYNDAKAQARIGIVQRLKSDFLEPESRYCVNISQKLRKKLRFLWAPDFACPDHALDVLRMEIELLMWDTFKRFRKSEQFKLALNNKTIALVKAKVNA